jgi:hypothetical protein
MYPCTACCLMSAGADACGGSGCLGDLLDEKQQVLRLKSLCVSTLGAMQEQLRQGL